MVFMCNTGYEDKLKLCTNIYLQQYNTTPSLTTSQSAIQKENPNEVNLTCIYTGKIYMQM